MFTPEDLRVRRFCREDQGEVLRMVNHIQGEEERAELRRQVKLVFLDPWVWTAAGMLICVVGILLEIPPIPASVGILVLAGVWTRSQWQLYWPKVQSIFNRESVDLKDIHDYYFVHGGSDGGGRQRVFLVAEHRGRIVGTAAVIRKPESDDDEHKTCKIWRVFVHPATRRMGIATNLVKQAMREAEGMGYSKVSIRTQSTNTGAIKLYKSLGFTHVRDVVASKTYFLKYLVAELETRL